MAIATTTDEGRIIRESFLECSIGGAAAAMGGIKGAAALVHGGPGCGWTARWARSDFAIVNYGPVIADNILRHDVIFGGEEKVTKALKWVASYWKPTVILLISGCAGSLISDPLDEIANAVEEESGIPVIFVDAPGFKGLAPYGMDEAFTKLLLRFAKDDVPKVKNSVNLIAPSLTGSGNWVYDTPEIKSLLEALGIKVNCILTYNTSIEEIANFNSAEADLYLTYEELPGVHEFENNHGLERLGLDLPLPLGVANTEDWYYGIARRFGKEAKAKKILKAQVKEHIAHLKYTYNCTWVSTWVSCKHAAVSGPATFAAAFANYLYFDMATFPAVITLYGDTEESIARAKQSLSELQKYYDPIILANPLSIEVEEAVKKRKIEFAFGQTQDKILYEGDCNVAHTTVAGMQTVLGTYNFIPYHSMGIKGVLYLLQILGKALEHTFHEPERWKALAFKSRGERTNDLRPL
jgi:nitrogenase molybdenum-iron protein alpha/beta subunit